MAPTINKLIGQLLLENGKIDENVLETALEKQSQDSGYLGEIIKDLGAITESDLNEALSFQLKIPVLSLSHFSVDNSVIELVPEKVVRKYKVFPIFKLNNTINLVVSDPMDADPMNAVQIQTGCSIEPVIATKSEIENAIEHEQTNPRDEPGHEVVINKDSFLYKIVSRQKILVNLGRIDNKSGSKMLELLAISLIEIIDRLHLLDLSKDIEGKDSKEIGCNLIFKKLDEQIGLKNILQKSFKNIRTEFDVTDALFNLIVNRLSSPSSKNAVSEWQEDQYDINEYKFLNS